MSYCVKCGRLISDSDSFCPECGILIHNCGQSFGGPGDRKVKPGAPYQILMCNYCHGTGISGRNRIIADKCPVCKGNGGVKVKKPYLSCMECSGTGRRSDISGSGICSACGGTGWISRL